MRPYLFAIALALALLFAPFAVGAQSAATATDGPTFANATYTGPPSCRDVLLPQVNPDTALHLCSIVRRPAEGGGLHIVSLFTFDGEFGTVDMLDYGYTDCFGADAWASRFSGTLKAVVNCKDGDGNDRRFVYVDTGILALPEGSSAPRRRRRPRRHGLAAGYGDRLEPTLLDRLKAILVGVGHDPKVVASARMVAFYVIPLAVEAYAAWAFGLHDPRLLGIPAATVALARAVGEGLIDQLKQGRADAAIPARE